MGRWMCDCGDGAVVVARFVRNDSIWALPPTSGEPLDPVFCACLQDDARLSVASNSKAAWNVLQIERSEQ